MAVGYWQMRIVVNSTWRLFIYFVSSWYGMFIAVVHVASVMGQSEWNRMTGCVVWGLQWQVNFGFNSKAIFRTREGRNSILLHEPWANHRAPKGHTFGEIWINSQQLFLFFWPWCFHGFFHPGFLWEGREQSWDQLQFTSLAGITTSDWAGLCRIWTCRNRRGALWCHPAAGVPIEKLVEMSWWVVSMSYAYVILPTYAELPVMICMHVCMVCLGWHGVGW